MPINTNNGTAIGKLYLFDGSAFDQIGKVYAHDGAAKALIYSAEETYVVSMKSADGKTYENVWKNTAVKGYTSVTLTIVVSGTNDIFWGGIATSKVTHSTASGSPSNALYNVKSVNGDNKGTHTKTLSLDASKTYYVYAGVYTGNTANNGSIKVTAVFS